MTVSDRREFLRGTTWMSLVALAGGCQLTRMGFGGAAPMANFAAPPLKRIRIGFVGVGSRGTWAVHRISLIPGVEISAICDSNPERLDENRAWLKEKGFSSAKEFGGDEGWRDLCDWGGIDVVYACTPWEMHVPVAVAAMKAGKHALVEVPAAMTVEDCWKLVETSEATHRHCMMLENCCYGENEMLALNLCRRGLLGDLVYGEAGYLHDCRSALKSTDRWRLTWYEQHQGNLYPTHGLGPVAQCLDINRGDRFDYLVSVETKAAGLAAYGRGIFPADDWRHDVKLLSGDVNNTLIRTVNGKSIFLGYSVHTPRPYSRINTVSGTKGIFMDYPLRIAFEKMIGDKSVHKFDEKTTAEIRETYRHPMWRTAGAIAEKVGGHGGMDFIMDLRWIYCLQNGLPLDMDVYDLASWSCLCELTERSVRNRAETVDVPDFTRGAWRTMRSLGIEDIDLDKMNFDKTRKITSDASAQTV